VSALDLRDHILCRLLDLLNRAASAHALHV
jgi:hypothetical protein